MKLFSIGFPFLLVVALSTLEVGDNYLNTYANGLKAYSIPSSSMKPTLQVGDRFYARESIADPTGLIEHLYPDYRIPLRIERGDILVFQLPTDPSIDYVKRVIGMPGETIQMIDGMVHIDGQPVKREKVESLVEQASTGNTRQLPRFRETLPNGVSYETLDVTPQGQMDNTREYKVPEGHYFVLGDNRDNSIDSRLLSRVGYIPAANVTGVATSIFYSGQGSKFVWRSLD